MQVKKEDFLKIYALNRIALGIRFSPLGIRFSRFSH
jgi:hypothetical protein